MSIFKVVSLGLLIVMLQFLIPEIFSGFQNTLLVFFKTIQTAMATSQSAMTAGFIPPTLP
jgi:hypothetical protein